MQEQGGHVTVSPAAADGTAAAACEEEEEEEEEGEEHAPVPRKRNRSRAKKPLEQTRAELESLQAQLKKRQQEDQDLHEKISWQQKELRAHVLERGAEIAAIAAGKTKALAEWLQSRCWKGAGDIHVATVDDLRSAQNTLKQRLLEYYRRVKGSREPDFYPSRDMTAVSICCSEDMSFELARFTLFSDRLTLVVRCFCGFGSSEFPDELLENVLIPWEESWIECFPSSAAHNRDGDAPFLLWMDDNMAVSQMRRQSMDNPMALLCQGDGVPVPLTNLDDLFASARDAGEFAASAKAAKLYNTYKKLPPTHKEWLLQMFQSQARQFLTVTASTANTNLHVDEVKFVDGDFISRAWQGALVFDGWKIF